MQRSHWHASANNATVVTLDIYPGVGRMGEYDENDEDAGPTLFTHEAR
jgi:hypothetical protein